TAASEKAMRSLAHKLRGFEVEKDSIGWKLDQLEDLALESSESGEELEADVDKKVDVATSTSDSITSLAQNLAEDTQQMQSLSIDEEQQIRMPDTALDVPSRKKLVQIIGEDNTDTNDDDNDNDDENEKNR
ncbi:hypothetical protein LPJ73_009213, partial [Coemansia sp. RSA 2703]